MAKVVAQQTSSQKSNVADRSILATSEQSRAHSSEHARNSASNAELNVLKVESGAIHLPPGSNSFTLARVSASNTRSVEAISIAADTKAITVKGSYTITRQADNSFIVTPAPEFKGAFSVTTPDRKTVTLSTTSTSQYDANSAKTSVIIKPSVATQAEKASPSNTTVHAQSVNSAALAGELKVTFARYQSTIGKDAPLAKGNSTWQSFNTEYQQLVRSYEKQLINDGKNLPSTQSALQEVAKVNKALNDLFDRYANQKINFPKQSAKATSIEPEQKLASSPVSESSWQSKAKALFEKINNLNKTVEQELRAHATNPTAATEAAHARNTAYTERHSLFAKLYENKELRSDSAIMSSLMKHWDTMVTNYESEQAKTQVSSPFSNFALSVNQAITTAASSPATIGLRYNKEMTETAVRSQLLAEVKLSPTRTPTASEMVDLLKLEKLLTKVSGPQLPGEPAPSLNSADHEAIIQSLVREKFSQPHKLANEAIKSAGISPNSETAIGIRYALLGHDSLPADIKRQLEFGERVSQKQFQGPLRRYITGEYQKGIAKLEDGKNQAIASITNEIRKQAKAGLVEISESSGALKSHQVDSTPRNVTEAELRELSNLAGKLASIGSPDGTPGKSAYLIAVEERTGTKIDPFVPSGLNVGMIKHFISAATQFTPPTGAPPGVAFGVTKEK